MHTIHTKRVISLLALSALVASCALEEPEEEPGSGLKVEEVEAGVFRIDATSEEEWVFLDLDTRLEATESEGWELAFQRTIIAANGANNVQVAHLDEVDLDDVENAPESGYWLDGDRPSGDTGRGGGGEGLAFHDGDDWYAYDLASHQVAPKGQRVYVVLSDEGRAFGLQIMAYYDDAGTGGIFTLRVEEIVPPVDPEEPGRPGDKEPGEPDPYEEMTIDASDREAWVYLDLDTGEESEADAGWDIAFQQHVVATNGPEGVGVFMLPDVTIDDVSSPPADEYATDDPEGETGELAFHGEDPWYEYDMETHAFDVKERVYVLMTTEGAFFAIQMIGYTNDDGTPGYPTFRYKEIE